MEKCPNCGEEQKKILEFSGEPPAVFAMNLIWDVQHLEEASMQAKHELLQLYVTIPETFGLHQIFASRQQPNMYVYTFIYVYFR